MSGAPHNPADRLPPRWLRVPWPVAERVLAFVSTRDGGVSQAPYDSLNLGLHVGDRVADVQENRRRLMQVLPAGVSLQWLEQVHGCTVVDAAADGRVRTGDAVYVDRVGQGGLVMTADCLPVFFASADGRRGAVAHAGWRGLLDGVLEATLARFPDAPGDLHVWFGPAIGPCHFEVGEEVREAFVTAAPPSLQESLMASFRLTQRPGKFLADLYRLASLRLNAAGVPAPRGGGLCTVCDRERFFSYRRDGISGRFASVLVLLP